MIDELEAIPEGYHYGVLCKSDDVGNFIIWFNTRELGPAEALTSCITNHKNCLIRGKK